MAPGILTEIAYLLERRMPAAVNIFLGDIESGAFTLDCGEADTPRVRELSPLRRPVAGPCGRHGDRLCGAESWPRADL